MLELAPDVSGPLRAALGYRDAADAVFDIRGFTVRCVPWRRTVAFTLADGTRCYRKLAVGRDDARAEWRWLARARALGLRTPSALCFAARGRDTVVVLAAAPGRPIAAWLHDALRGGDPAAVATLLRALNRAVAPRVRRLHDQGVVYRDLYWNHVLSEHPLDAADEPTFLDVGRMLRPRWRRRRWFVKDLAGLLASVPAAQLQPTRAQALRFLRAYFGELPADWKSWARAIVAKAQRIRRHAPKYG